MLNEKTIEINYLSELVRRLPFMRFTILGPSRVYENDLGYDAMLEGLPAGQLFAIQFKRPLERADGYARFTINVNQLQVLLDRFQQRQAFYALLPYTRTRDFIIAHQNGSFIGNTRLLDVHDILHGRKTTQKSRTIKFIDINTIEVTDPWKYEEIPKSYGMEEIESLIMDNAIGLKTPKKAEDKEKKRNYGGQNFYIHYARNNN